MTEDQGIRIGGQQTGCAEVPIHQDPSVQYVDVRVYFDRESYTHDDCVDKVADALGNAPELGCMISAYELKEGQPDDDAPLA